MVPGYRDRVLPRRLPWVAVLATLATAVLLLFGPLWDDAAGENPLQRPPGPDWDVLLRLGLPTVVVAASLVVALALPRNLLVAVLGLLLFGYAVLWAPAPLAAREPGSLDVLLWFLPALALTAAGLGLGAYDRWRGRSGGRRIPA